MKQMVIAIDGPAASGKSTAAAKVAGRLGIPYINTGNMFRAVTLLARRAGVRTAEACTAERIAPLLADCRIDFVRNAAGEFELELNGTLPGAELRSPEVAALVSPVATLPAVRDALKRRQRELAAGRLVVMEGRDIGTVVFPEAQYKFFITASPEERARRRLAQSGENLSGATLAEVARGIAERDRIDSTRAVAPLRPAPDAVMIDNTDMTADQVAELIVERVRRHDA